MTDHQPHLLFVTSLTSYRGRPSLRQSAPRCLSRLRMLEGLVSALPTRPTQGAGAASSGSSVPGCVVQSQTTRPASTDGSWPAEASGENFSKASLAFDSIFVI